MDAELLKILACPACKGDVKQVDDELVCQNKTCSKRFPIRDGIPIMIVEEAK